MAELKTKENDASVEAFMNSIADEQKRKDSLQLVKLMQKITGQKPKMWGTSIIGFGSYHYKYASGHEGEAPVVGFSPRKQNFALYLMGGFHGQDSLLKKLGKHKVGKGCLYLNSLKDVNVDALQELIRISFEAMNKQIEMRKKNS